MSLEWEQCSWERGDQAGRIYLQVMPLLGQLLVFVCIFQSCLCSGIK